MQDKSLGLPMGQGRLSQGTRPLSGSACRHCGGGALGCLGKPRTSELYTCRCSVKQEWVGSGSSSKPLLQRRALPAAARLGSSATVPNSSGVIVVPSSTHPHQPLSPYLRSVTLRSALGCRWGARDPRDGSFPAAARCLPRPPPARAAPTARTPRTPRGRCALAGTPTSGRGAQTAGALR